MSEQAKAKGGFIQKLWVPVVLVIGLAVGELLSFINSSPQRGGSPPLGPMPHSFPSNPFFGVHIVFCTAEVALLVALVAIYVKTYAETRVRFTLGLVIVLSAFLVETLLSYPFVATFLGPIAFGPAVPSTLEDVITTCAYAVFLYLSIE